MEYTDETEIHLKELNELESEDEESQQEEEKKEEKEEEKEGTKKIEDVEKRKKKSSTAIFNDFVNKVDLIKNSTKTSLYKKFKNSINSLIKDIPNIEDFKKNSKIIKESDILIIEEIYNIYMEILNNKDIKFNEEKGKLIVDDSIIKSIKKKTKSQITKIVGSDKNKINMFISNLLIYTPIKALRNSLCEISHQITLIKNKNINELKDIEKKITSIDKEIKFKSNEIITVPKKIDNDKLNKLIQSYNGISKELKKLDNIVYSRITTEEFERGFINKKLLLLKECSDFDSLETIIDDCKKELKKYNLSDLIPILENYTNVCPQSLISKYSIPYDDMLIDTDKYIIIPAKINKLPIGLSKKESDDDSKKVKHIRKMDNLVFDKIYNLIENIIYIFTISNFDLKKTKQNINKLQYVIKNINELVLKDDFECNTKIYNIITKYYTRLQNESFRYYKKEQKKLLKLKNKDKKQLFTEFGSNFIYHYLTKFGKEKTDKNDFTGFDKALDINFDNIIKSICGEDIKYFTDLKTELEIENSTVRFPSFNKEQITSTVFKQIKFNTEIKNIFRIIQTNLKDKQTEFGKISNDTLIFINYIIRNYISDITKIALCTRAATGYKIITMDQIYKYCELIEEM